VKVTVNWNFLSNCKVALQDAASRVAGAGYKKHISVVIIVRVAGSGEKSSFSPNNNSGRDSPRYFLVLPKR
jgi:hypothetical protein